MVDGLLQNMQTYFCRVGSQKMAKAGYFLQQNLSIPSSPVLLRETVNQFTLGFYSFIPYTSALTE